MFVCFPGLSELYIYGKISDPEVVPYHPRVRRGIDYEPPPHLNSVSEAFHTLRGGIHAGGCRISPGFFEVVTIWRNLLSRDGTLSSSGVVAPRWVCPAQIVYIEPATSDMYHVNHNILPQLQFKVLSKQQGWLDGFQNCLGTVPRPRFGAA